ncbi:MAG: trypsin-like peptidase domain-containing protein [Bacteroidota bacterium]
MRSISLLILIILLIFSGCTLIIKNRSKTYVKTTPEKDAQLSYIYVTRSQYEIPTTGKIKGGKSDTIIRIDNRRAFTLIEASKEGYKTTNFLVSRTLFNPFSLLDLPLLFFTVGAYHYILGTSELKPFKKYSDFIEIKNFYKYPHKKTSESFLNLVVSKTDGPSEGYIIPVGGPQYLYFDYIITNVTNYNYAHFQLNNSENFKNANKSLSMWGYIDSSGKSINKIDISGEVTEFSIRHYSGFLAINLKCYWRAENPLNKNKIYSSEYASFSNCIKIPNSYSTEISEKHRILLNALIFDAYERTMIQFLNDENFKKKASAFADLFNEIHDTFTFKISSDTSYQVKSLKESIQCNVVIKNDDHEASGIIIGDSGIILTSFEAASNSGLHNEVVFMNGKRSSYKIIKNFPRLNLSVIRADKSDHTGLHFSLNNSEIYEAGDEIYLINSEDSENTGTVTMNKGIISSTYMDENFEYLLTDVSFNSWNEGTAIVDKNGNLVGILISPYYSKKEITGRIISVKSLKKLFYF